MNENPNITGSYGEISGTYADTSGSYTCSGDIGPYIVPGDCTSSFDVSGLKEYLSGSFTGSLAKDSGTTTGTITGSIEDKLSYLLNEMRQLNERVKALYVKEVERALQLPVEIIEPVITEKRFVRKRLSRPLLEGEIRHAISMSKHGLMSEAARYLEVSLETFKKYCLYYDKHHTEGIFPYVRLWKASRGRKPLKRVDV